MTIARILSFALLGSIVFFWIMHIQSRVREKRIETVAKNTETIAVRVEQLLKMFHTVCVVLAETHTDIGVRSKLKAALILVQENNTEYKRRITDITDTSAT